MSLPILPSHASASPETLIRLFHQTERRWFNHLDEPEQLDVGTAICNPSLGSVRTANRMLDVSLAEGTTPAQAIEIVDGHFASNGARCLSWIMNPSADAERVAPMVQHLQSLGYKRASIDMLYLQRAPARSIREIAGLTIIPARASYRHAEQIAVEAMGDKPSPQRLQAMMAHLDDPHWDSLLALRGGKAIGIGGVMVVGEIGRIENLFVAPGARRQGVARTMISRLLEICARSLLKHIFLTCAGDNLPAQALYADLGFKRIGELVDYRAPT
jgi:ribosomal protein S18 acetylase RimI-like enzyme